MSHTVPMTQEDLTDFIIECLEKGKSQEEIRRETRRYAISDAEYSDALREALIGNYMHETANIKIVEPGVLVIIGLVLLVPGIIFIALLGGNLAPLLVSIMIALSSVFFIWAKRINTIIS